MVESNDLQSDNTMDSKTVKLITEQKQLLAETTLHMQMEIKKCFELLVDSLRSREKQLLRQVEAVHVQQLSLIHTNFELVPAEPLIKINLENKYEIQNKILHLGKLEISGKKCLTVKDTEPYKVEDYQEAHRDHEKLNKSIKSECQHCLPFVENQTESHCMVDTIKTMKTSEKSDVICNDSILNFSHNSSLSSSIESEDKSTHEPYVLMEVQFNENSKQQIEHGLTETDDVTGNNERESRNVDLNFGTISKKCSIIREYNEVRNSNSQEDINANKQQDSSKEITVFNDHHARRDSNEHPKQIQQWLQQILVETETEPMIHEIEQFSEISKVRLSSQFPLET